MAKNGYEALEIMTDNKIDLLITDIYMPIMDGKELLTHVSDIYPNTLNIALTQDIKENTLIDVVNNTHLFNYVNKPWDNQELLNIIEKAVGKIECIKNNYIHCREDFKKQTPIHSNKSYRPDELINILVVDDEKAITNSLRSLFRNKKYQLYTANSGEQGLALLQDNPIDIIISDIRMPNMNGVQFLNQVAKHYPDVLALVLSGYSDLSDMFEVTQNPIVYHYMCKPWDNKQLEEQVKKASERLYINRKGLND